MSSLRQLCEPLLNPDSLPLVRERLCSENLMGLSGWFWNGKDGNGGEILLETAPLFDTWLGRKTSSEEGNENEVAASLFGAGVMVGMLTRQMEHLCPFPNFMVLDEVLTVLSGIPDVEEFFPLEKGDALALAQELFELDPMIDVAAEACYRLCGPFALPASRSFALRMMFFGGLLATGIHLPAGIVEELE